MQPTNRVLKVFDCGAKLVLDKIGLICFDDRKKFTRRKTLTFDVDCTPVLMLRPLSARARI